MDDGNVFESYKCKKRADKMNEIIFIYYATQVVKNDNNVSMRAFLKWKKTIASALYWKKDVYNLYIYNYHLPKDNQDKWKKGLVECVNFAKYLKSVYWENDEMRGHLTTNDYRPLQGMVRTTMMDLMEVECKDFQTVPHGNSSDWYSIDDDWEALALQAKNMKF